MADMLFSTLKPQRGDSPQTMLARLAIALSTMALTGTQYTPAGMDLSFTTVKPQLKDSPDTILARMAVAIATIFTNGGFGVGYTIVSAGPYLATAGQRIQADTSSAAFTINLPAAASPGDTITVEDAKNTFVTNNLTLGFNGLKINGASANLVLNVSGSKRTAVYIDAAYGWSVK